MPQSPPLWSGRRPDETEGDHQWLEQPRPVLRPPAPEPDPPKRGLSTRAIAAIAGGVTAILLAIGVLLGTTILGGGSADESEPLAVSGGAAGPATRINKIYDQVSDGVVSVQVGRGGGSASSGTGFVVGADGTIVTNAHVVGEAEDAQVRFDDSGRPVAAEVVGSDPSSDLAVIRVSPRSAPRLRVLPFADSDQVRVGDTTVAVGYPLGLDRTATAGIVSGLGREIRAPNGFTIDQVIQTDAPINPGNSGGPLLDGRGRVIGVNSQIATAGSQGNVGIGFAVPSNTVRDVVPKLKGGKSIDRPFLGVSTAPALDGRGGAVVRDVNPGGPADDAGLKASTSPRGDDGDVITRIDQTQVVEPDDVANAIAGKKPGDEVQVRVRRNGKERTIVVVLGKRPKRAP